MGGFADLLEQS